MYKRIYTPDESKEIRQWYDRHTAELPQTLELNAATRYNNLPKTVATYFEIYSMHGDNPTFSGQMHQLYLIRQRLEELGIKD